MMIRIASNSNLSVTIYEDHDVAIADFSDGTRITHESDGRMKLFVRKHIANSAPDCYNPNTGGVYG